MATLCFELATAKIVAQETHTAVILKDSSVKVFGRADRCQIGLGNFDNIMTPTEVEWLGTTVLDFAVGDKFSIAVLKSGAVHGMGANSYGQMGMPASTGMYCSGAQINSITNAVSVAVGSMHALYLLKDGTAVGMGFNGNGCLGIGSTASTHEAVTISSLGTDVKQFSAAAWHSFALLKDGSVKSFGWNGNGQLGLGDKSTRHVPTLITSLGTNVAQIAAGSEFTLALMKDGSVQSFGSNTNGQLGMGDVSQRLNPSVITSLGTDVVQVAAGDRHALALMKDGSVKAWGKNEVGALGLGDNVDRLVPTTITDLGTDVVQLAGGTGYSCVVLSDGSAKCFGENTHGQLGLGDTSNSDQPRAVTSLGTNVAVPPVPPSPPTSPPAPLPPAANDGPQSVPARLQLNGATPTIWFGATESNDTPVCELSLDKSQPRLVSSCELTSAASSGRRLTSETVAADATKIHNDHEALKEEHRALKAAHQVMKEEQQAMKADIEALKRTLDTSA